MVNKGRDFSLFLLFNKGDCLFSGCYGVKIGACAFCLGMAVMKLFGLVLLLAALSGCAGTYARGYGNEHGAAGMVGRSFSW